MLSSFHLYSSLFYQNINSHKSHFTVAPIETSPEREKLRMKGLPLNLSTRQVHRDSPDELSGVKLRITAVEYCLANFGEIVVPETEEKNAVKIYQKFSQDRPMEQLGHLMEQLGQLQAEKLQLQAKDLELEKQKTISMGSTTGMLGSPSL